MDLVHYSRTRAGENSSRHQTSILAVQRAVTVSYSSTEVAAQQLKAEEQQRIFRFIPNLYVIYEPHPEPLTTKMKFELAYKESHPSSFLRSRGCVGRRSAGR